MTTEVSPQQAEANRTITLAVYILHAVSLFTGGLASLIAVIINYVKRDDVVGTVYASHFTWQIRTFWYSVLWGALGWLTVWIVIGFLIWGVACVWFIYRIAKGWVRLTEGKPMYAA